MQLQDHTPIGKIGKEGDGYRKIIKVKARKEIHQRNKGNNNYSVIDAVFKSNQYSQHCQVVIIEFSLIHHFIAYALKTPQMELIDTDNPICYPISLRCVKGIHVQKEQVVLRFKQMNGNDQTWIFGFEGYEEGLNSWIRCIQKIQKESFRKKPYEFCLQYGVYPIRRDLNNITRQQSSQIVVFDREKMDAIQPGPVITAGEIKQAILVLIDLQKERVMTVQKNIDRNSQHLRRIIMKNKITKCNQRGQQGITPTERQQPQQSVVSSKQSSMNLFRSSDGEQTQRTQSLEQSEMEQSQMEGINFYYNYEQEKSFQSNASFSKRHQYFLEVIQFSQSQSSEDRTIDYGLNFILDPNDLYLNLSMSSVRPTSSEQQEI